MSDTQQEIAAPESTNEQPLNINSEPQEKKHGTGIGGYFSTKRITQIAVFIALAIVLKIVGKALTFTPTMTATLIYIPWLLSGIVLGPFAGLIVCCFSDVLGNLIFSSMAGFNPLTLLSNTLYALPVALLYKTGIKNDYVKTILGSVISLFVCTLGIGSFALYWYYFMLNTPTAPISYWAWFIANRWFQPIVFAVNLVILCLLIRPLKKVGIFPESANESLPFKYNTVIAISIGILSAIVIAIVTLMAVSKVGSVLLYVMVPGIYLGLVAFLAVSVIESGSNRLFYNGIISIAMALLTVACAIIIPLTPVNGSFVPSAWFYLVALVPAATAALPIRELIKKNKTATSRRSFIVNLSGATLSILSFILLVLMVTFTITGIL